MKLSKTWQKVCVGVVGLVVLLFAGYGVKTAADGWWSGHYAVQKIDHNIETLSGGLKKRSSDLRETQKSLRSEKKKRDDLEDELENKEEDIKEYAGSIARLKNELARLQDKNNALTNASAADKAKYQVQMKNLLHQIDDLQGKSSRYQEEADNLRAENEAAENKIGKIQSDLDVTNAQLKKANNASAAKNQLLQQAEDDAQSTLEKSNQAVKDNDLDDDDD